MVDTCLHEANPDATYSYYTIYIFNSLSWRIYELVLLALILRTSIENTSLPGFNKLSILNNITIALLGVLSTAGFALYAASIQHWRKYGSSEAYLSKHTAEFSIAYDSLYLATVVLGTVIGLLVLHELRSKVSANFLCPG